MERLFDIAALFKAGKYIAFDNYAYRAKSEHLTLGGEGAVWTEHLKRVFDKCRHSVNRGAGIAKQSQPLDVLGVARLGLGDSPVNPGGPIGPGDFAVAGCLFMLREAEIAAARYEHVTIGPGQA